MNLWKKGIVIAIICLFIGAGAVPGTTSNIEKDYKEYTYHIENLVLDDQIDQQQTETEDVIDAKVSFGKELDDKIIVLAQSFKPTLPKLTKVDLLLRKKISSNGVTVFIKEDLDSNDSLASIQLENSQISDFPLWTTFDFDDVDVIPEETYYIVCTTDASALLLTYEWHFGFRDGELIDNYSRGIAHLFFNNMWDSEELTDFCFKTYGIPNGDNQYPVANFTWTPTNPKINEMIAFNASSSYDPDGNYYLNKGANDGCSYDGGNWAEEWLAANPNSDLADWVYQCGSCAHSQRLNCVLKGGAFWWLMARIAGWEGDSEQRALRVTSPNGSENWLVGSKHNITWVTKGEVGRVKIEYSTDDGENWKTIVSSTKNDSIYYWEIPDDVSADCLVRISEKNGTLVDTSDNLFEIISVMVRNINLSMQASRGEERAWLVQRQYGKIELLAGDIGSVKISKYVIYRKEAGGTYNIVKEIEGSEVPGGTFVHYDKYLERTKTYVYRALVLGTNGQILASSNEETV